MNDKNITTVKITVDDLPSGQTDWDTLDALGNETIHPHCPAPRRHAPPQRHPRDETGQVVDS